MDNKITFFIENGEGDFIVIDEYGDPVLDENGKEIEYTGEDRHKKMDNVYINKNRANNYTLDHGDNRYKKGGGKFDKKNYRGFNKNHKKR
jgi:hypothetical protein